NMQLVIRHLKDKYRRLGHKHVEDRVLTLIRTQDRAPYLLDELGNFWRMTILLMNTQSYDIVETPQQAWEGGRAFGQFQRLLSDLDVTLVHEVLPNFHHIGKRLEQFHRAISSDTMKRVSRVSM